MMKFSDLVQVLQGTASSRLNHSLALDPEIQRAAPIDTARVGELSYIEGGKFAQYLTSTQASAIILPQDEELQQQASGRQIAWVSVANPRMAFAQAIGLFYRPFHPAPGIHSSALIDPTVQLGKDVAIAANVVIQAGVILGDGVCIHPNVVVYPDSAIGDRTILHANCVIHERTQIGADCVIHSGAAIGSEGFGFVPTREGWFKMEQSGRTILEDGVEVGCNSTIDRPAVGETRIKRQTKIDNLVQVGHGVTLGQGCALAAQVGLAGGVTVGDRVILAGQVGVANQITIGSGVTATARAGIISDIDANTTVSGHPTVPHRTWLKTVATQQRLPTIQKQLRELQAQVRSLQRQLEDQPD